MKNKRKYLLAAVLFIAFVIACNILALKADHIIDNWHLPDQEQAGDVVKVAFVEDNIPYSYIDDEGRYAGYNVEIVYEIGRRAGFTVAPYSCSWQNAYSGIQTGDYDVLPSLAYNTLRSNLLEFSSPLLSIEYSVYGKKDVNLSSIPETEKKVAVVAKDISLESVIAPYNLLGHSVYYDDFAQCIDAVSSEECDYAIVPTIFANAYIEKNSIKNIKRSNKPIYSAINCIAVKKGNTQLIEKIEAALDSMIKDGTSDRIYNTWLKGYSGSRFITRTFNRYQYVIVINVIALILFVLLLFVLVDYSRKKRLGEKEDSLIFEIEHDLLTGVYNRAVSGRKIREALKKCDGKGALLVLDVDGLKRVNDSMGHDAGDSLIISFANAIVDYFPGDSIVGRIGGDEFIAFLKSVDDEKELQIQLRNFLYYLSVSETKGDSSPIRCCIGVAFVADATNDFTLLFKRADAAMYHAKRNGKNRFAIYNDEMQSFVNQSFSAIKTERKSRACSDDPKECQEREIYNKTFKLIMDNFTYQLPDTIALKDEDDFLVMVNPHNYEIVDVGKKIGVSAVNLRSEMCGQKCYVKLYGYDEPCQDCPAAQLGEDSFLVKYRSSNRKSNYLSRYRMVSMGGVNYVVCAIRDINTRNSLFRELEMSVESQNLISTCILGDMDNDDSFVTFMEIVLKNVCTHYNAGGAYINFVRDDLQPITYNIDVDKNPSFLQFDFMNFTNKKFSGMYERNILTYMPDVNELKEMAPESYLYLANKEVYSTAVVPIWDEDEVYGYLCIYNPKKNIRALNNLVTICASLKGHIKHLLQRIDSEHIRFYDALTGYLNYDGFKKDLRSILSQGLDNSLAICCWDVKRFKYINDVFGFKVGDALLMEIADAFAKMSNPGEIFCRISADLFCGICVYDSLEALQKRFDDIVYEVRQFFELHYDDRIKFDMYCGICPIEDDKTSIEELLNRATLAKNYTKNNELGSVGIYNEDLKNRTAREVLIESEIEQGLKFHEFKVYLQPQIYIGNGDSKRVYRAEALCRWIRDGAVYSYPGEFIPIFERSGKIPELDMYMLDAVCKSIKELEAKFGPIFRVSVNFSRLTLLKANFIDDFTRVCHKNNTDMSCVELEFTESIAADNFEDFYSVLTQLKQRGCVCSMDDFGSMNSSLNVLQNLPLDVLKLDKKFFDIRYDKKRHEAVVENTIDLARRLNMETIAEGIEEEGQLNFLKEVNCDYVQGYVFAKPLPVNEYAVWINNNTVERVEPAAL